jgi:N-acetylmuramoyl-L-alanine amidase
MSAIVRIVKQIILHHTESNRETTTLAMVDEWHAANGWGVDVGGRIIHCGYHGLITGDAAFHVARPASVIGAHAYGDNQQSVGYALTGMNDCTDAQVDTFVQVCAAQCKKTKAKDTRDGVLWLVTPETILGHRDVDPTDCPGDNLYHRLPEIRARVAAYLVA